LRGDGQAKSPEVGGTAFAYPCREVGGVTAPDGPVEIARPIVYDHTSRSKDHHLLNKERSVLKQLFICVVAVLVTTSVVNSTTPSDSDMDPIAEQYVRLVLAVGQHDAGYVDAFYGPEKWKHESEANKMTLDEIESQADAALEQLGSIDVSSADEMTVLRYQYLTKQLQSLASYVDILGGHEMSFDEETAALYDVVAPTHSAEYFEEALARLDELLPGDESLGERVDTYRSQFIIPAEKLDTVFVTAIAEARRRTELRLALPPNERFVLEYVSDKPWSGYNWYQGGSYSLIQLNTDAAMYIDRAIDLACHEGYPGHHVYNALLEYSLVDQRGWMEFSVYALFSPQSLIAEGSANYGIDVAFPRDARLAYERDVLFPLAGLDPREVDRYYEVLEVLSQLTYAGNEAARNYLNGDFTRDQAIKWLEDYAMMTNKRAEQRMKFIDTYRSYVINYNYGKDLVRRYVEEQGGTDDNPEKRWEVFQELLSSPRLPSGLN